MQRHSESKKHNVSLMLCNIRSAQNAGAIMRTADAVGVSEVILGGYTPGPLDRFGRERKEFTKASLGAEKNVSWRSIPNCRQELVLLKKSGSHILALEQSKDSVDYKKVVVPRKPTVAVLGNEVTGLRPQLLSLADVVAEIPMRGAKESLNVSVAAGIVLYRWFDPVRGRSRSEKYTGDKYA